MRRPAPPPRSGHASRSAPQSPAAPSRAMKSGKSTTPLPTVVKLPSAARSLAWAMAIRSPSRSIACGHDRARLGPIRPLEQVGRIEHDAQPRRAHLADQPHRVGRGGHDVGLLRLDAEIDAGGLGHLHRLGHLAAQVGPGGRRGVVRMMPPLVLGIAAAGAQRHQPDPEPARAPPASPPAGAGRPPAPSGRDGSCCRCPRAPRWPRRTRRQRRPGRPAPHPAIASGIGGRPTQAMLNWVHS